MNTLKIALKIAASFLIVFLLSGSIFAQIVEKSIVFEGSKRLYYEHIPKSYDGSKAIPLLIHLHGGLGSGKIVEPGTGWTSLSDQHNFIVVYPNGGTDARDGENFTWNTYFQKPAPNDVDFLLALINRLKSEYKIDTARIYMSGHSNGASMTNTFASVYTDILAAIAPVNGAWITGFDLPESSLKPNAPIPVWIWRGERETFQTGSQPRNVQDQNQKIFWTTFNKVNSTPEVVRDSDGKYSYTTEIFSGGDSEVRFTEVANQSHPYRAEYSKKIWNEFFSKQFRRQEQISTFSVTVANGSGSGSYQSGFKAHIWADPFPQSMVFDKWVGDVSSLDDPRAAHTTISNPSSASIRVTATFKTAPDVILSEEKINNSNCLYYFPSNPIGVVTIFHGSGGSANGVLTKTEGLRFVQELAASSYGVIALDSSDRSNKQWNNRDLSPTSNQDIKNVRQALDLFISRGLMTATTPLFSHGISNGGAFSSRISSILGFKAASIFIASGLDLSRIMTNIPTIWGVAENDSVIGKDGNQEALKNFQALQSRSVQAFYHNNTLSPVYPLRFWRISGLQPSDSEIIYRSIKDAGLLDENDFLKMNPRQSTEAFERVIPSQYRRFSQDILSQLEVCFTEHEFYSDINHLVIDFFDKARGVSSSDDKEAPKVSDVTLSSTKVKRKKDPQLTINWTATDNSAVIDQQILYAEDGVNFTFTVASGLGGEQSSFTWTVPSTLAKTKTGILKIVAKDRAGNVGEAVSRSFSIR